MLLRLQAIMVITIEVQYIHYQPTHNLNHTIVAVSTLLQRTHCGQNLRPILLCVHPFQPYLCYAVPLLHEGALRATLLSARSSPQQSSLLAPAIPALPGELFLPLFFPSELQPTFPFPAYNLLSSCDTNHVRNARRLLTLTDLYEAVRVSAKFLLFFKAKADVSCATASGQ